MAKDELKAFLISGLRRMSYKWRPRNEAKKRAKVSRGLYVCNHCKQIIRNKDIQIDHINPIVGPEGFTTWDNYIKGMFVNAEGYQALCSPCHKIKTDKEKAERKEHRQLTKVKD